MAEIQSESVGRKRDKPDNDPELEKLDNLSASKLSLKEDYFQKTPTKTSRFSPTQSAVISQPGYSDNMLEAGRSQFAYSSTGHQQVALSETSSEYKGKLK